ncbi:MAG: epoxyqueuosine reductase QueH [Dehalococcoidales bacterium]|nr:epoxyqueuosine reductase QueH [Dehalococcoidales bacterium]
MKNNSILIHCCCAHCAAYTIYHWQQQGYEVSALWYNPNIHPYSEHQCRLEAIKLLAQKMDFPLIVAGDYDMMDYFRQVAGNESSRCQYCFKLRLLKTAEIAQRKGFKSFTSSLLISPHQKHELLLQIGNNVAKEKNIKFLNADLRKRYSDSRHMTKRLNLYRQQYCGCIYSEWERYAALCIIA